MADAYAIFEIGGHQYRAVKGGKLRIEYRADAKPGDDLKFDRVLSLRTDAGLKVGTPTVKGAAVSAKVVEHTRADKVIIFHMRRREGHRRKKGHRQHYTLIEVIGIEA